MTGPAGMRPRPLPTPGSIPDVLWKVPLIAAAAGLSVWMGFIIPSGGWLPLLAVALPVLLVMVVTTSLTNLLLMAVVLSSFNFTLVLFNGQNPADQPLYLQALRDLFLLLLLANFMGRQIVHPRTRLGLPQTILDPLMLWSAFIFIRSFHTDTTPLAAFRFLRYLIIYPLMFLLVVPSWNITERGFRRIVRLLFLCAAIVFVLAFLDGLTSFGNTWVTTGITEGLTFTRTRAISTLGNPNNLGSYAGFLVVILAVFHAEGAVRKFAPGWIGLALLVGATGSILLSFSRGALLAFVFVAPWILHMHFRHRRTGRGLLVAALAFAVLFPIISTVADVRGPYSSIDRRIGQLPANLDLMAERPWSYVVGLGIARGVTRGDSPLSIVGEDFTRSDNFFLLIFVESGLIGLGLFLFLLASILRTLYRSWKTSTSPFERASHALAIGLILYVAGWGLSAVSFRLFPAGFLVWMFVAIALSMARLRQRQLSQGAEPDIVTRSLPLRNTSAGPGP